MGKIINIEGQVYDTDQLCYTQFEDLNLDSAYNPSFYKWYKDVEGNYHKYNGETLNTLITSSKKGMRSAVNLNKLALVGSITDCYLMDDSAYFSNLTDFMALHSKYPSYSDVSVLESNQITQITDAEEKAWDHGCDWDIFSHYTIPFYHIKDSNVEQRVNAVGCTIYSNGQNDAYSYSSTPEGLKSNKEYKMQFVDYEIDVFFDNFSGMYHPYVITSDGSNMYVEHGYYADYKKSGDWIGPWLDWNTTPNKTTLTGTFTNCEYYWIAYNLKNISIPAKTKKGHNVYAGKVSVTSWSSYETGSDKKFAYDAQVLHTFYVDPSGEWWRKRILPNNEIRDVTEDERTFLDSILSTAYDGANAVVQCGSWGQETARSTAFIHFGDRGYDFGVAAIANWQAIQKGTPAISLKNRDKTKYSLRFLGYPIFYDYPAAAPTDKDYVLTSNNLSGELYVWGGSGNSFAYATNDAYIANDKTKMKHLGYTTFAGGNRHDFYWRAHSEITVFSYRWKNYPNGTYSLPAGIIIRIKHK